MSLSKFFYTEWLLLLSFFLIAIFQITPRSHIMLPFFSIQRISGHPQSQNRTIPRRNKDTLPSRLDLLVGVFFSLSSPATFFITRRTTTKRFLPRGSPGFFWLILLLGSFKDKIEIVPPQSFRTGRRPSDGAGGVVRLLVWLSWTFVTFDWPGAVGSLWASPGGTTLPLENPGTAGRVQTHQRVKLWGNWWEAGRTGMLAAKYIG